MEKITPPTVTLLAEGKDLIVKQMQGFSGQAMPIHHTSVESIVFVFEGECIFRMNEKETVLKSGEAIAIPPLVKHQIKVVKDFKGIHFMPNEIVFEFFN